MSEDYRGKYLLWNGAPARVISDTLGERFIGIEMLEERKCPHCDKPIGRERFEVVEASPLFRDSAKPLPTLEAKS